MGSFIRGMLYGVTTIIRLLLLLLILFVIIILSFLATIPSRVGTYISIEKWAEQGLSLFVDRELMISFRDDILHRIGPHISFEDDLDRYGVLREMDQSIDQHETNLQSGEYLFAISIAVGGILMDSPIYNIPLSYILASLTVALSGLVVIRVVLVNILSFESENHLEEDMDELALRMAFNRGSVTGAGPVGIAILTLLIGVSGGIGYNTGLGLVEWVAERRHPDDGERWIAEGNNLTILDELASLLD